MIKIEEYGYEIVTADEESMTNICMELCKGGFHFQAIWDKGYWHIYLTGGF